MAWQCINATGLASRSDQVAKAPNVGGARSENVDTSWLMRSLEQRLVNVRHKGVLLVRRQIGALGAAEIAAQDDMGGHGGAEALGHGDPGPP